MKKLSLPKASIGILLLSIPLNFIAFSGLGNVYVSTLIIFILFIALLALSDGKILARRASISAFLVFACLFTLTLINVFFNGLNGINKQLVFTIIYFQSFLVFIISYYAIQKVRLDFIFNFFLAVAVLISLRLAIEEYGNLFNFSSVRGQRIEANFAGAVNNFAMLMGLALIISFFYIRNKTLKITLSIYWLFLIILTMSRGALLGVVLTFFIVSFYDTNTKTLKNLFRICFALLIIGVVSLYYFDKIDVVLVTLQERFLGFMSGEASVKQFASGRGLIFMDILKNHLMKSNLFEFLFGHGMGSIDFSVNGSPYESSHNIFMDLVYRNGILFLLLYMLMFIYILLRFLCFRNKKNIILFGIFIFLHLELLVNPFLFAVQTGWIYAFFMAAFLVVLRNEYTYDYLKKAS